MSGRPSEIGVKCKTGKREPGKKSKKEGRIFIARHGESTWNAQERWAGHDDPPLTEYGRKQARDACSRIAKYSFKGVTSSPLSRARETAVIFSRGLNSDLLEPVPELMEIDAGAISGLTSDEITVNYPGLIDKWRGGFPVDMPGGETWNAFKDRVLKGIHRLQFITDPVLVIAHEGVLRAIAYYMNVPAGRTAPTYCPVKWPAF